MVEMIVVVLYHNICFGVVISYEIVEMMLVPSGDIVEIDLGVV